MSPAATSIAKSLPPLRVDALVKRFGEMTALDGITLEVHSGECLGLLGPNGAGKSTLIRSIVGRVIPEAGTISVFGAQADSMSARTALGWVPQELALYPDSHVARTCNRSAVITDSVAYRLTRPSRGASAGPLSLIEPESSSRTSLEA